MKDMENRTNMDQLDGLLRAVRKRLLLRRLLSCSSRNLLAVLVLLVPAAVVLFAWSAPRITAPAGVLCLAALVAALVESLASKPQTLDAALFVDRHLGLHERLSSYVQFARSPAPSGSFAEKMALALENDAARQAREISAAQVCPVLLPKTAPFTATALFCVAALILGTAPDGAAKGTGPVASELDPMLTAQVAVNIDLPPDLQEAYDKLKKDDPLEAPADRLGTLLKQRQALNDLKTSLKQAPEKITSEDVEDLLARQPGVRDRLEALLESLGEPKDPALRAALEKARRALRENSAEELAAVLKQLIGELTAQTAGHDFMKLQQLQQKLKSDGASASDDANITRTVETGGDPTPSNNAGEADPAAEFPADAVLKAQGAVDSGRIPPRYRWAVERYFQYEPPQQEARDR